MKIFLLFWLIFHALCNGTEKPIQDVIEGTWNLTKLDLTNEGLLNPDSLLNYSFKLTSPEDNQTYFADIYGLSSPDSHTLKLSFNFNELNSEHSSGKEYFTLIFDDNFTVEGELIKSADSIRRSVGAISRPLNTSYSFIILSSYRAELTLFYRDIQKTSIFRFMKQYDTGIFSGFGKYASYLMRKMLFRMI